MGVLLRWVASGACSKIRSGVLAEDGRWVGRRRPELYNSKVSTRWSRAH